jgi:hypothetical protein
MNKIKKDVEKVDLNFISLKLYMSLVKLFNIKF